MSEETFSKQAARAAYGWGRMRNWDDALALLAEAARAGEAGAERQLALVTQAPIADLLIPPTPERLSDISRIGVARGFAPPGFSDWLIDKVSDRLVEAGVNDASGMGVRTATTAAFGPQHRDLVLAIMQIRAGRMAGTPINQHEPPNVISYQPGQSFSAHVDFIDPAVPQFHDELEQLGQRSATIVTYLNDDFDGAETFFPDAGVKFRGGTGDALIWANLMPNGTPDYHSGHSALPPTRGRKWVLSQWIRTKPYPYPPELLA
ncbi:2OG-Fe(II) oxygenase [Sphingomonas sp.]|uniref:2OG-Fe(II) oxygenase n=1 Tax=Sphingomonas sp. TaxID=28214 RepID=UPI00286A8721|nr:2OG-Fe(II) oxygenase [Sphingomonas sp.]